MIQTMSQLYAQCLVPVHFRRLWMCNRWTGVLDIAEQGLTYLSCADIQYNDMPLLYGAQQSSNDAVVRVASLALPHS